ncbi:MAG: VOC family protein [Deltaproteobacteria bacterium]|nr:VOC family protein [bacterium]MCB9475909.1 VOC family protein [Deltaproteobacteria bacterium]MCB9479698.1 VOC family protein [Deltaproteobacteria bacterium]MCB9488029.1 VOC family protein [Deltaproteobacteria bacterium]
MAEKVKVAGLGGVFFKCGDPKATGAWYAEHLGLPVEEYGHAVLPWRRFDDPDRTEYTVWSPFPSDTEYFGSGSAPFMMNFIVHDLNALVAQLAEAGIKLEGDIQEMEYGRFAWITDPNGVRIELWQPSEQMPEAE